MYRFLNLIYRFYPVAIAGLLAAGAIWLERTTRSPETASDDATLQTPDFIAQTVHITGFGADGHLHHTLDSPRIFHLPVTGSTHVEQPRLYLISRERQQVWINADHGVVSPKGERVDFFDNVKVEREAVPGDVPARLFSAQLTVWPQEQHAVSNVPVQLVQGETRADAHHFEADNIFGVMKLSGKVRARLIPRQQKKRRS